MIVLLLPKKQPALTGTTGTKYLFSTGQALTCKVGVSSSCPGVISQVSLCTEVLSTCFFLLSANFRVAFFSLSDNVFVVVALVTFLCCCFFVFYFSSFNFFFNSFRLFSFVTALSFGFIFHQKISFPFSSLIFKPLC